MNINEIIKQKRIEKNISQRELGRRIDKTGQFISLIEKGTNKPSIDTLKDIAEALDVSMIDLIKDDTVNISDMNNDDMNFYIECIIEKPELKPLINIFKNNGYTLHQELKGSNIHLLKDGKEKAYISEKDFINFGMSMINNINEFTEFQFNKLLDIFTLLS